METRLQVGASLVFRTGWLRFPRWGDGAVLGTFCAMSCVAGGHLEEYFKDTRHKFDGSWVYGILVMRSCQFCDFFIVQGLAFSVFVFWRSRHVARWFSFFTGPTFAAAIRSFSLFRVSLLSWRSSRLPSTPRSLEPWIGRVYWSRCGRTCSHLPRPLSLVSV